MDEENVAYAHNGLLLSRTKKRMKFNLENIMLSEESQTQMNKYYMTPFTRTTSNMQIHGETESRSEVTRGTRRNSSLMISFRLGLNETVHRDTCACIQLCERT